MRRSEPNSGRRCPKLQNSGQYLECAKELGNLSVGGYGLVLLNMVSNLGKVAFGAVAKDETVSWAVIHVWKTSLLFCCDVGRELLAGMFSVLGVLAAVELFDACFYVVHELLATCQ